MPLLPSGTRVAETEVEHIVRPQAVQRLGGSLFVRSHELLDGHTHIVVNHRVRHSLYLPEKVAVRLHERQRVLTREQPCPAHIAMTGGEHSHIQLAKHTAYGDFHLAPVELAFLPRSISLTHISFGVALRRSLLFVGDITADGLVAYLNALSRQNLPYVDFLELLLAHALPAPLAVKLQIPVYLRRYGLRQLARLTPTAVVGRL